MEELFKACADQTRLRILNMLACEGEVCVCHFVDVLQTNQPKVSRHLAYLKRAGLVTDRKDGLWVHYRLAAPLAAHAERLLACLASCCVEVPEMQQDVANLRAARGAQPLVKLTSRQPKTVLPETKEDKNSASYQPEAQPGIQIELL
ncbi:MAG TPA: metalloregulator ArsR/SmtB family transcription factor [Blastocatellia bacterium]|nr:metalloregulator ArsR/SmtB family transcription factor [Blastocatellia bacterium]